MKPAAAKAKGRRLQNQIATLIRAWFGLSDLEVRPAIMGETGMDIKLGEKARTIFPFAVECKQQEALNIWQALKQAEENAEENLTPILIFSRNRSPVYVVMPILPFFDLVARSAPSDQEDKTE